MRARCWALSDRHDAAQLPSTLLPQLAQASIVSKFPGVFNGVFRRDMAVLPAHIPRRSENSPNQCDIRCFFDLTGPVIHDIPVAVAGRQSSSSCIKTQPNLAIFHAYLHLDLCRFLNMRSRRSRSGTHLSPARFSPFLASRLLYPGIVKATEIRTPFFSTQRARRRHNNTRRLPSRDVKILHGFKNIAVVAETNCNDYPSYRSTRT